MTKFTEKILQVISCIETIKAIIFVGIGIAMLSFPSYIFIGDKLLSVGFWLIGAVIAFFGLVCYIIGVIQRKF